VDNRFLNVSLNSVPSVCHDKQHLHTQTHWSWCGYSFDYTI